VVAIGETGLDYFKSTVDPDVQKKSFMMHLELASNLDLPVIVHNRGADEDTFSLLRQFPKVRAVFHCFGSNLDFARVLWAKEYLTSFTGIITYPNAVDLRKVVEAVPKNLFMVETDCPYLAPQSTRGKRNEPSFVRDVLAQLAEVKGLSFEDADLLSTENARMFFDLRLSKEALTSS
ncbi:TatD family hydrolase, partial [Candidatus Peregrinibacteria bacterium]|nr:TatD family hydrolase [Candidatus Peregrinibacteria bacterium]